MTSLPTEGLVIDATVLHGFLAGGNAVRALVHMPAWRKVGPRAQPPCPVTRAPR